MCIAVGAIALGDAGSGPRPSRARAALTCAAVAGWPASLHSSIAAHRFSSELAPLPVIAFIGISANTACRAS